MARDAVGLVRHRVKTKTSLYEYWYLRWFGSNGKEVSECIGKVGEVSKRQAQKLKRQKMRELEERPGRRNVNTAPTLSEYLKSYFDNRKSEPNFSSGTCGLHRQTAKYLVGFFGEQRRIDQISRAEARSFKTALASGKLKHISQRPRDLGQATVDMHVRNARTMLGFAVKDDIVLYNPLDRLSSTPTVERGWHYVTFEEYEKLMEHAPGPNWKLLMALCRLAALRRGEALSLEWSDIDFEHGRIRIIAKDHWQPKDKAKRILPIDPELQPLLSEAFNEAPAGSTKVIEGVVVNNSWRDFQVLFKRSEVERYRKPFHALRKSCITDWAGKYPAHVVKEWAGHSSYDTTGRYYLQLSESEYERAARESIRDKKSGQKSGQKPISAKSLDLTDSGSHYRITG